MRLLSRADFFLFQAEDGIRDLVRSRGLGDVYKRQRWRGGDGSDRLSELAQGSQAQLRPGPDDDVVVQLSLIHI